MNNFSKLFFGFAAATMMFSCSSDEPANNGGNNTGDGDVLYMRVKIKDANSSSSYGKGSDGGYVFGDAKESNIADARFFFYDNAGNFLMESGLADLGNNNGTAGTTNVEYVADAAIVLQGLKDDELPKYMLTVLNAPTDFTSEITLEQTARKVAALTDAAGNFVMSTSSFFGGDTQKYNDTYYYANMLQTTDFFKTKEEALEDSNPVTVYVERLAAKFSITGINEGYNEVKVTVAGNPNGDITEDGAKPEAGTKLYVKFDKWGVTHTEKSSYLSKNLSADNPWSFSATNTTIGTWNWNKSGDFRSYWGASYSYGNATPDLNILTHGTCEAAVSEAVYAAETTNTKDNVSLSNGTVNINNVTCALLTATVYSKNEETGVYSPLDLVLYNGIYYTEAQFKQYVLQIVNNKTPLNYWICENPDAPTTETKKYHQVKPTEVVLYKPEGAATASVQVKFASDDATLYAKTEGKEEYTPINNGVTALNNDLKTFFGTGNTTPKVAISYKGGKMFYTVPVEHLLGKSADAVPYAVENEANYGTVRNHWYQINVKSVAKLGHGIFNPGTGEVPGEPLIPENPNDDRFNLGAEINILSWKVVKQDVDL